MKGDFSKMTFNPEKNFLRVLMQQGRVQLDADWNEQAAILLHYMQTLAVDLIGEHGGPVANLGFTIGKGSGRNFALGKGRYYVDGILCENHQEVTYLPQADKNAQPDYFPDPDNKDENLTTDGNYLVYLDVWERHISFLEDGDILEKALNGVDTATRSKVIWQVKVQKLDAGNRDTTCDNVMEVLKKHQIIELSQVSLNVQIHPGTPSTDPCCQHPDAKYRGVENQLYRIEIHDDGKKSGKPTFKWSRDNGSVVFPVTNIDFDEMNEKITVHLESLGRDDKLQIAKNDWVELVDDVSVLHQKVQPLYQVQAVDPITRTVTLKGTLPETDDSKHPLLRRWDSGAVEMDFKADWIPIEAGIEVHFDGNEKAALRTGDYWLIPARANNTNEDWQKMGGKPHGVDHHYAPLAIINVTANGISLVGDPCQHSFGTIVNLDEAISASLKK